MFLLKSQLCLIAGIFVLSSVITTPVDDGQLDELSFLEDLDDDVEDFRTSSARARALKLLGIYAKANGGVDYTYYARHIPAEGQKMDKETTGPAFPGFNQKLPTKVLVHGWLGNGGQWYAKELKDEILLRKNMNVIVVDWSKHGSQSNYIHASQRVKKVGEELAEFLKMLEKHHGYPISKLHLMGHSLGAHICGVAGKILGGKVDRITGFDPAGVMYKEDTEDRLRPESAKFVDAIHTCTNRLGHTMSMGHVDFFPNGGKAPQPGCGSDVAGTCSHSRAYEYYVDSFVKAAILPAVECENWDKFKSKECNFKKVNFIGEDTNRKVTGRFFLETNDKKPFGKGLSWV